VALEELVVNGKYDVQLNGCLLFLREPTSNELVMNRIPEIQEMQLGIRSPALDL
jgi:hypothetical protein